MEGFVQHRVFKVHRALRPNALMPHTSRCSIVHGASARPQTPLAVSPPIGRSLSNFLPIEACRRGMKTRAAACPCRAIGSTCVTCRPPAGGGGGTVQRGRGERLPFNSTPSSRRRPHMVLIRPTGPGAFVRPDWGSWSRYTCVCVWGGGGSRVCCAVDGLGRSKPEQEGEGGGEWSGRRASSAPFTGPASRGCPQTELYSELRLEGIHHR